MSQLKTVAVLGAGNMGHGIAEVSAIAGYDVVLRDIQDNLVEEGYNRIEESLEKLAEKHLLEEDPDVILSRISTETDLETSVASADLVIEAVPEQLELKKEIFSTVDASAPDHAILATNTSSLSISDIASATERPGQVLGLHFFNPVYRMDLVEVIYGDKTSDETIETAATYVDAIDKTPVYVRKDVHGFVTTSTIVPYMDEAAWMLDAGETTIQEADAAMVFERGYPMGPFELNDFGGIDVYYHTLDEIDAPVPACVKEKIETDELGRKSGRGFYSYDGGDGVNYSPDDAGGFDTLRVEARVINRAAWLVGNDVATPEEIDLAMRLGTRFPEGPCRTGDKLGLDVVYDKLTELYDATGASRYEPAHYLEELVADGHVGEQAGRGFYDYADPPYLYIDHGIDDDGVLTVTFDRQERLNAFNEDMFTEVQRLLETVNPDDVSCVVFEGSGDRAFSAGADITGFTTTSPTRMAETDDVFQTVYTFDRPTIAKIDGFCLGAGFELALACDFRIATERAQIGSPEIDLGVIPAGGATQRLVRLVGEMRAKEIVLRAQRFDGAQAAEWGIVNCAVPDAELEETLEAYVSDLSEGPPIAMKLAKQIINHGQNASLEAALAYESQGFGLLASTEDMVEGVTAFREGRDPEFSGE